MYHRTILRFLKNYRVNIVIRLLIVSDFLIWAANQLFAPIFAIFITEQIHGGSVEVVGISAAIYFVAKAVFEIPVGMYIDRTKAEKDDLYSAIIGTLGTALVVLWFTQITEVWQLYTTQVLMGLMAAVAFPGWYSIFTRHVDENKAAFEWSLYDVLLGLGMAAAAVIGGLVVEKYGFDIVFYISAISSGIGAVLLLLLRNKIYK